MQNEEKTQYKRFSSTSFIFVSCLRAFSYYASISPEKCPKYLSFCVFVLRFHHHFCTKFSFSKYQIYIRVLLPVFCIVCETDALH